MKYNQSEISEKVISTISYYSKISKDDLSFNTELNTEMIDSLNIVEIIFELEGVFDIDIPQKNYNTIYDLVVTIQELVKD